MSAKSPKTHTEGFVFRDDPTVLRALRAVRERTGIPLSILLRRAVRVVLEQHARPTKPSAPADPLI